MTLTKNKFFLSSLFIILIGGLFLIGVNQSQAVGAAYFPQDTTVAMTVDNFTIVGPSDADAVTTTATTVTVTISGGENFTFRSSAGRRLDTTSSGNIVSSTCTPSSSSIVIKPDSGASARTVVITPQTAGCTATTNNSGGTSTAAVVNTGGGGATVALATPTPTPTVTPPPTPTSSSTPTPSSTPAPGLTATPNPAYTPAPASLPGAESAKLYRKSGDDKIYVVQANGLLKWVKSLDDFNSAGYLWQNVKVVSKRAFSNLKIDVSSDAPILTTPLPGTVLSHLKLKKGVKLVNIRSASSVKGKIVGRALSGQEFEFSDFQNGWYKIKKDGKDLGWISGAYTSKF